MATSPPGATVFVDGQLRGDAPLRVPVSPGAHDVVAERPRYATAHAHVDGPGRVQLALARPSATLHVTSTPPGAAVTIDGDYAGTTPLDIAAAAYELHHVVVERDGHLWRRRVYLRPPSAAVHVGGARRSIDQTGTVRVAHDLREGVRP